MRRTDRRVAAGLVAITLGTSWILAATGGTIGVPRTDDWGFAREAYALHRTGHFHLISWGPMTIVGHLLWAQPFLAAFGDHLWVLDLATSALVAAGVVAAYSLARRRMGPAASATAVAVLLLFPGVVRDASTYMTDPTALALQLVTLGLAAAALQAVGRQRQAVLFGAAMAAGFWAFSIRELAAAAPLAVLAAAFVGVRARRTRAQLIGAAAVWGAACLALWVWHRHLPGIEAYRGRPPLTTSAIAVVGAALTAALGVAPALALSATRWWRPRHVAGRVAGAVAGVAVIAAAPLLAGHAHQRNWWFVGDYLQSDGINGGKLLLGHRPIVIGAAWWHLLIGVAMVSTVVCAALIGEWVAVRCRRGVAAPADRVASLVTWHIGLTGMVLTFAAVWNGALYDRYLWPLVFSASVVLLGRSPVSAPGSAPASVRAGSRVAGAAVVLLVGAATALLTLDSAAFDAARWHAAEQAVRDGTPAAQVDGGFEWSGAHSTVPNSTAIAPLLDGLISWWSAYTGMTQVCVVVTASPIDSALGTEIRTEHWRTWLVAGSATLHVYRLTAPACAGP